MLSCSMRQPSSMPTTLPCLLRKWCAERGDRPPLEYASETNGSPRGPGGGTHAVASPDRCGGPRQRRLGEVAAGRDDVLAGPTAHPVAVRRPRRVARATRRARVGGRSAQPVSAGRPRRRRLLRPAVPARELAGGRRHLAGMAVRDRVRGAVRALAVRVRAPHDPPAERSRRRGIAGAGGGELHPCRRRRPDDSQGGGGHSRGITGAWTSGPPDRRVAWRGRRRPSQR